MKKSINKADELSKGKVSLNDILEHVDFAEIVLQASIKAF